MNISLNAVVASGVFLFAASGCSSPKQESRQAGTARTDGIVYTVKDTNAQATFEASGTAAALRQATLSTKLMGSVLEVLVKEGDVVSAGQPVVRIDARDLSAKDILLMPEPAYFGGTVDRSMGSNVVAEGVVAKGKTAFALADRPACGDKLVDLAQPGDIIVVMGARDDTLSEFAADVLRRVGEKSF